MKLKQPMFQLGVKYIVQYVAMNLVKVIKICLNETHNKTL
jgi:hypothetical protein